MTTRRVASDPVRDLPTEDVVQIQGDEAPTDQDAILDEDDVEHGRESTLTELDHGYPVRDPVFEHGETETLDGLDLDDLRQEETDDPQAAAEEGLTYVPPIDPPVVADPEASDGITVAAGQAVSAESDPYDQSHRGSDLTAEPELDARIHEALRADAQTAGLADRLIVGTRGSVAVIRGVVDDVDDSDSIVEVVTRVRGITDVVDETELAG